MSCICIGGICIPYSAIIPLILVGFKWIIEKLQKLGLMPTFIAKKLNHFFPSTFDAVGGGSNGGMNCVNGVCSLPGSNNNSSCCSSSKEEEEKTDDIQSNNNNNNNNSISRNKPHPSSPKLNHRHPKPQIYNKSLRKTPEKNFIGIESIDEWDSLCIDSKKNMTPIIVDFTASWCKPCQRIGPFFKSLAKDYDGIFVKVDVDELDELAVRANVKVMPTFAVYFGTTQVDKSSGADEGQLEKMVGKFASKFCE